ncbi:MAG: Smr/MutS family protein [Alphaproteobacteria bacterium]|nr:Smr/MutS family protein [Alphaproteobacteria bacterium]
MSEHDSDFESDTVLWQRLCADVRPLKAGYQAASTPIENTPETSAVPAVPRLVQKKSVTLPSAEDLLRLKSWNWQQERIAFAKLETPRFFAELDGRRAQRFRSGKLKPDAVLDLHGQTEREAARNFARFFARAVQRNHRSVLVIAGKGAGVLRRGLADWLENPSVRAHLAGVSAMPHHKGGSGAYGLYLRRQKQTSDDKSSHGRIA